MISSAESLARALLDEIRQREDSRREVQFMERARIIALLQVMGDYVPRKWGGAVPEIVKGDPELLAVADEIASKMLAALDPGGRAGRPSTACNCDRCRAHAARGLNEAQGEESQP